jgi:hypothetical protein
MVIAQLLLILITTGKAIPISKTATFGMNGGKAHHTIRKVSQHNMYRHSEEAYRIQEPSTRLTASSKVMIAFEDAQFYSNVANYESDKRSSQSPCIFLNRFGSDRSKLLSPMPFLP